MLDEIDGDVIWSVLGTATVLSGSGSPESSLVLPRHTSLLFFQCTPCAHPFQHFSFNRHPEPASATVPRHVASLMDGGGDTTLIQTRIKSLPPNLLLGTLIFPGWCF